MMQLILDEKKIQLIREIVNDSPIFYESPKFKPKWNLICSFMDRIEDSVRELNGLMLTSDREISYNAMMLMFVYTDIIRSCIDILLVEFDFTSENLENSSIFNEKGFDSQGTDDKYFYFLRNLSFAHVLKVDRYNTYLVSNGEKESLCAPIVSDNGSEIIITVYSNIRKTPEVSPVVEKLKIFNYILRKYSVLDEVECGLRKIINGYELNWSQQFVDTSKNITEILEQLKEFYIARYDRYTTNHIEEVIQLLEYKPQIQQNIKPVENFQKYAFTLSLDFIERFNSKDTSTQNHDFYNLFNFSCDIGIQNSNYMLEKIQVYLTEDESGENSYGYSPEETIVPHDEKVYLGFNQLKEFKRNFSDKYLTINYDMPFYEIQILVSTVLYIFHEDDYAQ